MGLKKMYVYLTCTCKKELDGPQLLHMELEACLSLFLWQDELQEQSQRYIGAHRLRQQTFTFTFTRTFDTEVNLVSDTSLSSTQYLDLSAAFKCDAAIPYTSHNATP